MGVYCCNCVDSFNSVADLLMLILLLLDLYTADNLYNIAVLFVLA